MNGESLKDKVLNVKKAIRRDLTNQIYDPFLEIDEITTNVNMALELLNEIDNLDDDTIIEVTFNPMGCYQYEIVNKGDDEMNKEKEYYNEKYYMECLFYLAIEIYSMYLKGEAILVDIFYEKMCEITDKYLDHDNKNKSLLDSVLDFINDEKDYILERVNESVVEDENFTHEYKEDKMEIGVDTKININKVINELEFMIIEDKGVIDNILYKERDTKTSLEENDIDKINKIRYKISKLEKIITMLKEIMK